MKIQLTINSDLEETEVHIHAKAYNEQIEQLMKQLQASSTSQKTVVDGYLQQEIHLLKITEIFSIYAEDAKVYLQTDEQEFETKRKLYELEEQLAKDFVRVNKSTLVNVHKISSIQMGKIGATQLILENDTGIPVSRKYLKDLKHHLGIGKD
ncbi:LytTR family DNA-binding domain-containing protein [Metasolibacillus sp.]|uniref:LytTR family DNA-binding domain-containing protein n=1 Tax=Metasolibacillus sp. TaxID=2703680 RepID=UPI0025E09FEF|nr:LytTR family DNA-binding domain-containing protein [Metasolibacillus sp.]MCT6924920.1 LytTR family transcriptional regulator DNA-binding domain-containing protein [Metasolibacillus sp.]MCT6941205.1 LytTR family transcriptional regulator DNA-binding domain-containing protein [Metasolibacillus sp.]